jgi:DNA-binding NarL/FixJ family response regulator
MATHLLIVDDSKQVRTSLRALLVRLEGVTTIHEAASLSDAMGSARLDPPTLVILDLAMPDGLGTEIIQPLKQISPTLRIAMLTLRSGPAYREHCLQLGADWFFDKATDVDELLEVVRQHAAFTPLIHPNQGSPDA